MSKHTPGPWEADMFPDTQGYKIRVGGRVLAIVKTGDNSPAMEPQMNRHLIAAAPELLEALEDIVNDYCERFDMGSPSTNPGMKSVVQAGLYAIARARGEA